MSDPPGGLPGDYTIQTPLFMRRVSVGERRSCIRCGAAVGEGRLLCSRCRRAHPDDTILSLDTLYFLSCLSMILALLIINPGIFSGDILDPGEAGISGSLLLFLPLAAMLPAYFTSPRLFLTKSHLESLAFITGLVLLTGGGVSLIFTGSALFILATLFGVILIFPSRSLFKRLRPEVTASLFSGTLLLFLSFTSTTALERGRPGHWFLTGGALASSGFILLFASSSHFLRRLELPAKAALPHTVLTAGIATLSISLYRLQGHEGNLTPGELFPAELGLVLLFTGVSTYAQKRCAERVVGENLKSIEGAIDRAERFSEEGHLFYALQHVDRALKDNLIYSLGSGGVEGILHRIEMPSPLRAVEASPGEYEIAHREKASLLVAQYNVPGAIAEYMEAIRHNPDYLEPYLDLASLLSTLPGREKEEKRFLNYYLATCLLRLSRWMTAGLPSRYVQWAERSYSLFEKALHLKMSILRRIGNPQEVWSFYSLSGGSGDLNLTG